MDGWIPCPPYIRPCYLSVKYNVIKTKDALNCDKIILLISFFMSINVKREFGIAALQKALAMEVGLLHFKALTGNFISAVRDIAFNEAIKSSL